MEHENQLCGRTMDVAEMLVPVVDGEQKVMMMKKNDEDRTDESRRAHGSLVVKEMTEGQRWNWMMEESELDVVIENHCRCQE